MSGVMKASEEFVGNNLTREQIASSPRRCRGLQVLNRLGHGLFVFILYILRKIMFRGIRGIRDPVPRTADRVYRGTTLAEMTN